MDMTDLRTKAENGDRDAQFTLGLTYSNRSGGDRDYVEAYKWLQLSGAKQALGMISHLMTPDQIAEAQKRASACLPLSGPAHEMGASL